MITYLLATASPTHGVAPSLYYSGWVGESSNHPYANGQTYYGIKLAVGFKQGSPLFFTEYSYMGLDPRQLRDRFLSRPAGSPVGSVRIRRLSTCSRTGYRVLHGTESSAHGSDDREQSHRRSVEGVYVKSGDSYNDREPWARPIISPVSYTPRGSSAVNPPPLVEGVDYYLENGLLVFTAHYLRSRGYCCQSGCRHCPYGFMKDPSTLEQCPE